ncbi:hypothetical protein AX14_000880 [Amanita brunnescens Koide BX004]|nr:hypothetical protein AX14_000880 [Amanita brunnescens Koide BX004]
MVQYTFATSIILVQLALLAQNSVGIPIESVGTLESRGQGQSSYPSTNLGMQAGLRSRSGQFGAEGPKLESRGRIGHFFRKLKEHFTGKKPDANGTPGNGNEAQAGSNAGGGYGTQGGNNAGGYGTQGGNNAGGYGTEGGNGETGGGYGKRELDERDYDDMDGLSRRGLEELAGKLFHHGNNAAPPPQDSSADTSANGKRSFGDLEERGEWDELQERDYYGLDELD